MADVKNVTYAKPKIGGAISVGTEEATLPKDAKSELTGFTSLGYISEDGLSNSNELDTDTIKAWGGDTVLVLNNGSEDKFTFTLIESLNVDVLKYVYGSENVTGTLAEGINIASNAKPKEDLPIVVDMIMKGGILRRIVIPNGSILETGEITYKDDEAVGYEMTVLAQPDTDGNSHYEYIVKG